MLYYTRNEGEREAAQHLPTMKGEHIMKNSEFKVTIDATHINIFTEDDMNAMKVFIMTNEIETVRDAFVILNRLFHGEPLKVSAEFCKNSKASGVLSDDGLDVWLNLWTFDAYNNRVINVQTYITTVWNITDSEQGLELVRENGLLMIYNKQ